MECNKKWEGWQLTENRYHEPIQPFTNKIMQVKINYATRFAKDIKDNRKRSFTYPAERHQGKLLLWVRCGDAGIITPNAFSGKAVLTLEL